MIDQNQLTHGREFDLFFFKLISIEIVQRELLALE